MGSNSLLDRSEFDELIRKHYGLVLRTASQALRDKEAAADVAQNTFLKAWTARKKLRSQDAFVPWILTICRREAWAIRAENKSTFSLIAPEEYLDARNESTARNNSNLFLALGALPEKDIDLIILKYFAGYSLKDIAILHRISAAKAKSRLHSARQKLQKSFRCLSSHTISDTLKQRRIGLMNGIQVMDLGSWCLPRLSFISQLALCKSSRENGKFPQSVLEELSELPTGSEWVGTCEGKLSEKELVSVLVCCDNGTIERILLAQEDKRLEGEVLKWKEQFYMVRQNDPVLSTPDMEKLIDWFEQALGWRGVIGHRDDNGKGIYGCVCMDEWQGLEKGTRGFSGFHLYRDDYGQEVSAVVDVRGLERLRQRIEQATDEKQPELCDEGWGAMTFVVSSPFGHKIKFYEWIKPEDMVAPYRKEQ